MIDSVIDTTQSAPRRRKVTRTLQSRVVKWKSPWNGEEGKEKEGGGEDKDKGSSAGRCPGARCRKQEKQENG
eukprot:749110-Hanusia_phi.AAC.1